LRLRWVNRLEREGYIEGYRAMLRRDQIGLGLTVFVGVIDGHANEMATAFEEAIVAFPEVVSPHLISGDAGIELTALPSDCGDGESRNGTQHNGFDSEFRLPFQRPSDL
jgi:Lrp/AsnC family leucine-responsive transcriptional regulator